MNAVDRFEKALANAGRLTKSAGFADQVRAVVADFRDFERRLERLEKADAATQSARLDFADFTDARIAKLESELAALRARHDGDISGVSATIGRSAPSGLGSAKSPPAARSVDHWRQ
jgi:hypothetical protein